MAYAPIDRTLWNFEKGSWRADHARLLTALAESGYSEQLLRSRLGHCYGHIERAIAGELLSTWAVRYIQWALSPNTGFFFTDEFRRGMICG